MQGIDHLTEEFKFKYERFLIGCDALEDGKQWDRETLGEMEAYYQNDLMGVILRVTAADGVIRGKEAEYLNRTFGFSYTAEELAEFYENCRSAYGKPFEEQARAGYLLMKSVSEKLAEAYRELMELVCSILIASDGIIDQKEIDALKKARAAIFGTAEQG